MGGGGGGQEVEAKDSNDRKKSGLFYLFLFHKVGGLWNESVFLNPNFESPEDGGWGGGEDC